jgi:hypothetical protein
LYLVQCHVTLEVKHKRCLLPFQLLLAEPEALAVIEDRGTGVTGGILVHTLNHNGIRTRRPWDSWEAKYMKYDKCC